MPDAGRIDIRLRLADGQVAAAGIRSQRPQVAAVLRGKPADEAVRLLPLVFAVCGRAQGQAAALALAAARGAEAPPRLDAAIAIEVMREHLWRLLLDLPPRLGLPGQRELFLAGQQAVASGNRAALQAVLADACWNALRSGLDGLEQPAGSGVALLPALSAAASVAAWPQFDAVFACTPAWRGAAAETGAFARRSSPPPTVAGAFAARWLARRDELQAWADGTEKVGAGGTASAAASGPNRGRAAVETARGLLLHEITLDGACIADYAIIAPTEWNFHPQGSLCGWLRGRPFADDAALRRFVGHAVAALDPCVEWTLVLE